MSAAAGLPASVRRIESHWVSAQVTTQLRRSIVSGVLEQELRREAQQTVVEAFRLRDADVAAEALDEHLGRNEDLVDEVLSGPGAP